MSKILYWHVKLFQRYQVPSLVASGGISKVQVSAGYAIDKPRFRPDAEFVIELFTTPSALGTIFIRTCSIDSMVCTPVCEEEPKSTNHETPELPKQESFKLIILPLIQWLNENSNPHAIIVIDPTSAALCTSETGFTTEEFLKDWRRYRSHSPSSSDNAKQQVIQHDKTGLGRPSKTVPVRTCQNRHFPKRLVRSAGTELLKYGALYQGNELWCEFAEGKCEESCEFAEGERARESRESRA